MKRKLRVLGVSLLVSLLILVSGFFLFKSVRPTDPFNPPDFTPTKAPELWSTFGKSSHYVKVSSIAPEKMPATAIKLPESQNAALLMPLSDGGCLSVSQVPVDKTDTSGNSPSILRAVRFAADGAAAWDRRYESSPFRGYPITMCVTSDDGFAVSLRIARAGSSTADSMDSLRRFGPDGELLWISAEGAAASGTLDHLFSTQDGAVITAGTVAEARLAGTDPDFGVGLLRFEKDGTLSRHLTLGMQDRYDSLMDASYAAGTGLVLTWRSESEKGDSGAAGSAFAQNSRIGCYTERLEEKWLAVLPATERSQAVQALPDGKGTFAFGTIADTSSPEASRTALFCFDGKGAKSWSYIMDRENAWTRAAVSLPDGRYVSGTYWSDEKDGERTVLSVLSGEGKHQTDLEQMPGMVNQLIPTKDGGFTAILRQTVRTIPQPPHISSIWFDSETIVEHYDKNLHIVWRRTIDQYKHALRTDAVVATVDDCLLIG